MDNDEELFFKFKGNSFSKPSQSNDSLSDCLLWRRANGTEEEGTEQSNLLNRLIQDSWLECFDVSKDIGQFRHAEIVTGMMIESGN
jgi:hypothetical protein